MSSARNGPPRRGFPLKLEHLQTEPRRLVESVDRARSPEGTVGTPAAAPKGVGPKAVAGGLGLDGTVVRARMIERLRASGIRDEIVLDAMGRVPRHCFVDSALVAQAYEDTSLPIGLSQTISKPSVVARMLELLRRGQDGRQQLGKVLEIGTGCGYQAAVLAELSRQVFSIERLQPLHDKARENLSTLRRNNLRLVFADGRLGHPPNAPYDAIISAAGGDTVPQAWIDQLAPGGRLVAPTSIDGAVDTQALLVIDRGQQGELIRTVHEAVRFVPLKSGIN